jgi:homoserine dehydrogenase
VPVLEAVGRLRGELRSIQGVMNGTSNFLLGKLGEGSDFAHAVAEAQVLGFAEADPSADVDGDDAAAKLSILIRLAFGVSLPPDLIPKQSLRDLPDGAAAAALANNRVLKQVGRCEMRDDGSIHAEVSLCELPADHPLSAPRNEENCFLLGRADGGVHILHGKGAGRWPTAASVMADVMDIQRECAAAIQRAPLRLTA